MSAALEQGHALNQATNPSMSEPKDATYLEVFNKAVSAYSVSHKEYVNALLAGNVDPATLAALEQTANANYAKVISTGSVVSNNTSKLISQDNDANYGVQLRENRDKLNSVVKMLTAEQTKLQSFMGINGTGETATQDFKTQAITEQNRYILWMIASVIVVMLIAAYLS